MGLGYSILLVLSFVFVLNPVTAQSKRQKKDSMNFYKNIEAYSKKSKVAKMVYQLIFKPEETNSKKIAPDKKAKKRIPGINYAACEGKIIRNIYITTLDPFGYTIADTIVADQNFLNKAGNKLHIKSRQMTIRNLLLIRKNQKFDSLLVRESERLIRKQRYVQDVLFSFKANAASFDSVDIYIRQLDNWTIIPGLAADPSSVTIGMDDNNILGFGHEFKNSLKWNHESGRSAFRTTYHVPNIRNTYISTSMQHQYDEYGNYSSSFRSERPFFSPLAKWAGGILIAQDYKKDSFQFGGFELTPVTLKYNTLDLWAGHAIQLYKGNSVDERTTNLILSGRFIRLRYLQQPDQIYDTQQIFSNEDIYLAAVGISTRKFVQDRYIFNYGIMEDVPVGKIYGLTAGYQFKNQSSRLYLGLRYAIGNYTMLGYLSSNFEYGTFFRSSQPEQGVLSASMSYFTQLLSIGNWKLRQFLKPELTIGIHRFSYDSLTLHEEVGGLEGFNSAAHTGTNRFLMSFQTQTYSPWKLLGFRFGPYFNYSIGILGDAKNGFDKSRLYSHITFGVLIKNEKLIINTFQFSFSFYPSIPGYGNNIFKINSFESTDFGFRDFEFGKPRISEYK